jgi:hypothetical protein
MEPMKPMKHLKPMEPMPAAARWWPEDLGNPASSGGQNEMRFAFFPEDYVLLVEASGKITAYDSGNHQITGVTQGKSKALSFSSQNGTISLNELKQIDLPE